MSTPIYIEYSFKVSPRDPGTEILIAELGYAGFESFVENEHGVVAYIQKPMISNDLLDEVMILKNDMFKINFEVKEIEQVNWNEEWEKNFQPITVEDQCTVRAPFHDVPDTKYDIIIEPKMSFGTGHHETTHMMLQHILELDCTDKKILDMGCGTGVLAILAEKRGGRPIDAIDIDNWCYLNTVENADRNNCEHITSYEGTSDLLQGKQYDIVIANINRNILLSDIPVYAATLSKGGTLLLSGFYDIDIPKISARCEEFGLEYVKNFERNSWVAVKYSKL